MLHRIHLQVHHVRLHAAPSQRAYLPQWLAAPLGRRKPADGEAKAKPPAAAGPGALPPIAEHGSTASSRRISADLSHLKASAAPPPPLSRECLPPHVMPAAVNIPMSVSMSLSMLSTALLPPSPCCLYLAILRALSCKCAAGRDMWCCAGCRGAAHAEHRLGAAAAGAGSAGVLKFEWSMVTETVLQTSF